VRKKVFNWSEVHLYRSNFLQNPYFRCNFENNFLGLNSIVCLFVSTGLNSIHSDGIPYGEELSESGAQYLWSSDTDLTISSSTQTTTKKVDSDEKHDENDLDIIDNESDHNGA
jgi:hypothetical protein